MPPDLLTIKAWIKIIFGVIIQTRVIIRLNKVFCIIICIMSWYGDILYMVLLFKYGPLLD